VDNRVYSGSLARVIRVVSSLLYLCYSLLGFVLVTLCELLSLLTVYWLFAKIPPLWTLYAAIFIDHLFYSNDRRQHITCHML
jgi:hypothetical protein